MSDDFNPDPFGIKDHMERAAQAQQRAQMEGEVLVHNLHDYFDTLDREQLNLVAALIRIVHNNDAMAYLYLGILTERLASRHGVCRACGQNHDEQLLGELHGE